MARHLGGWSCTRAKAAPEGGERSTRAAPPAPWLAHVPGPSHPMPPPPARGRRAGYGSLCSCTRLSTPGPLPRLSDPLAGERGSHQPCRWRQAPHPCWGQAWAEERVPNWPRGVLGGGAHGVRSSLAPQGGGCTPACTAKQSRAVATPLPLQPGSPSGVTNPAASSPRGGRRPGSSVSYLQLDSFPPAAESVGECQLCPAVLRGPEPHGESTSCTRPRAARGRRRRWAHSHGGRIKISCK